MTIQEIFDYVDEIKLNSFSTLSKTIWLNEIEGKIQNEIMLLAQPECIRYVYESRSESGMEFKDDHTLVLPRPIKAHIGGMLTISDTELNDTTAEILNISSDGKTYSFAEGTFSNTGTAEGKLDFDGKDTELLVQYPFDRIYASWLLVKISEHLEESAQDANSTAKFKDDWEIFAAWYADTYRPADGVPAFKGYYLTGKTGERGRDGAPGPAGKGIVRLYVESGRLKYELSDGSIGDAGAVSGIEIDPTLTTEGAAADAKATGDAIGAVADDVTDIVNLIPLQASTQNQLADKGFVNSSISTNTAYYISNNGQPFTSLAQLQAYSGTVTNNDYAFVVGTDAEGNTTYTRYKYNADTHSWGAEFVLNNSSFTAAQWAAIESGITAALVASYNAHLANDDIHVTAADKIAWNGKLTDAPSDGKQYARKNGAWSEVQSGGADNTFVVTGAYDGDAIRNISKTYAEILAAHEAKKIVELHLVTDELGTGFALPLRGTNVSGEISFRGFDGGRYESDHDAIEVIVNSANVWSLVYVDYAKKSDLGGYVAKSQGVANVNKVLAVGADGNVTVKAITDIIADGDEVSY